MDLISIKVSGIDEAIKEIQQCKKDLPAKARRVVERIAEAGFPVAQAKFATAVYAGDNDVFVVAPRWIDAEHLVIEAMGQAVAFIEFGTGVHYAEQYPIEYTGEGLVGRGRFGHTLGKFDTWRYKGNPGNEGEIIQEGKHKGEVLTHGNPPARALYDAGLKAEEQIEAIVKEVFG